MKTNNPKKLMILQVLSVLTIVIGLLLLTFMIVVEDEPGAIPMLLILFGTGWYLFTRHKIRSQHT